MDGVELRVPPLLLEYDMEQPPFPEGYKIKPEVVITVSTAPPRPEPLPAEPAALDENRPAGAQGVLGGKALD